MFMVIGFSALVWLVPWCIIVPSRQAAALRADSGLNLSGFLETPRKKLIISFNRNLLGICLGLFFYNYRWYLLVTWLPTYLVSVRKMNIMTAGVLAAIPYWLYACMQPIGGRIGDFLVQKGFEETRVRKGLVAIGFLCGLLILPIPLVESSTLVIGLLMVSSLIGISVANMLVIGQTCAPPSEIGIWAGASNFAGNIAGILAPVATGYLVERTGSYLIPFALGAGAMVPAMLAYLFVVGKVQSPRDPYQIPAGSQS